MVNLRGLPPLLHGDGLRLGQILLNFASNAVKFTHHGRITFSADRVGETPDSLLANDDLDSAAVLDEHRALLAAALGAPTATLAQAIETFDYERALLTLRAAVAATPAAAVQA